MLIKKNELPLVLPALFLVLTAIFPLVRTWGGSYYYQFVEPKSLYIYALCVVVLAINILSKTKTDDLRRWLYIGNFLIILLVGSWTYSMTQDGFEWMVKQATVDAPASLSGTNYYPLYWNSYRNLLGDVNAFGGIQAMYERYGSGVLYNGNSIFVNTINNATVADLKTILATSGKSITRIPVGLIFVFFAAFFQLVLYKKFMFQQELTRA